jgi:hypothetical protein
MSFSVVMVGLTAFWLFPWHGWCSASLLESGDCRSEPAGAFWVKPSIALVNAD